MQLTWGHMVSSLLQLFLEFGCHLIQAGKKQPYRFLKEQFTFIRKVCRDLLTPMLKEEMGAVFCLFFFKTTFPNSS